MAYITSQDYKNHLYDGTEQVLNIIINGTPIDSAYIRNVKLKDDIFNDSTFSLGTANICKIELELNNDIVQELGTFDEVTFESTMNISNPETIPIGTFLVNQVDTSSKYYTKYILYDYMSKFDITYDGSLIVPCTRYQLLSNICDVCGVILENESIVNGEEIVGVFDNTIIARDYIKFIAERAGGFAKINRNNHLEIKNFNSLDSITLPTEMIGEYEVNELKTITGVIYENGIQKYESGTTLGETIYLSQENPFSCTQAELDNIFDVLNGVQYQTLKVRIWGDSAIDTGDIIIANGYKTFAQKDWTWGNGWYGSYNTVLNKCDSISNTQKVSDKVKIKRLQSKIDEVEGQISVTAELVTEQNAKISNVTQTIDGLNIAISEQQNIFDNLSNSIVGIEGTLNNMEFDFSTRGLAIGTASDANNSLLNNTGIKVYNYDKLNAIFNNRGSGIDKLIVTGTAQIGYLKFVKSTKDNKPVTKIFHLKELIEDLEDLE